ncbi:nucleoid-associated protein YgaU [Chitinivorax tropicus]|uniref:Nucleoid-associated protein YgaU n=1 Tax=Chitinivorax tropicus TaxID=714531 RepID=A0A840MG92_9PROT|nr:tail protein X [Chitinivorax tropicus]MBB5017420.1 nucleoid-associated protein YgaU [Chitinivorax tropicus]
MYLTHITTAGERWDQLAARYYGDPMLYQDLIAANPQVPLVSVLPSGLPLSIPIIEQARLHEELPPWKR